MAKTVIESAQSISWKALVTQRPEIETYGVRNVWDGRAKVLGLLTHTLWYSFNAPKIIHMPAQIYTTNSIIYKYLNQHIYRVLIRSRHINFKMCTTIMLYSE